MIEHIEDVEENISNAKKAITCKSDQVSSKIYEIESTNIDDTSEIKLSLEGIEEKLSEKIESQINRLLQRQETVFNDMEECRVQSSDDVRFFKDDAKDLIEKVNEVSTRLFDFEQNKRNNLIFYGIPNCPDETPSILNKKVHTVNNFEKSHDQISKPTNKNIILNSFFRFWKYSKICFKYAKIWNLKK